LHKTRADLYFSSHANLHASTLLSLASDALFSCLHTLASALACTA